MALHDQKWPFMTQNVHVWPQMALKHFPWVYYMILCHAGPPWGLFRGPGGPCGPLKRPQGGPIWHIIMYYAPEKCFMAIWGHAGTFWVMKGLHWSIILGHEEPFWAMKAFKNILKFMKKGDFIIVQRRLFEDSGSRAINFLRKIREAHMNMSDE